MISLAEVKRFAGASGVEPRVIDLDYVLGCYLDCLSNQKDIQKNWIFKGGTALRKCYFENYRFSEDLDFTILSKLSVSDFKDILTSANRVIQDAVGIRTDIREAIIDVIEDEYGKESYEAKLYYQGPWNYGDSHRSIQIHVNREELIVFPPNCLSVIHHYSDKVDLPKAILQVYSLEEIMAEKLRAFSGQRKQAIPHDIFDIYHLSTKEIHLEKVIRAFPEKCRAKGLLFAEINLEKIIARKAVYETNWRSNLEYLIPRSLKIPFETAWNVAILHLKNIAKRNNQK